ncbi:MAG: PIN domain-containing protein [Cryobacterium sp.]|nr:PIN domain-containing protein [Cryobacterium sp.]MBX3089285.1 PIN domain-containing protein [Cryobacterium sp.]MCO5294549.1 PIN domain-containing protein [Homoserinimonas sp.]MCW5944597.1 PIN domain-containing protein [Cryobacterium sp.]
MNVLLAAFRGDHVHHPSAKHWLERTLASGVRVLIPDLVWVGFVRLVTNNHIFEVPSTPHEAFEFVEAICGSRAYSSVPGLVDGLELFRQTVLESNSWGNLVPDAYLASIARTHAVPLASFDRDFRRFDGLEIVVPA